MSHWPSDEEVRDYELGKKEWPYKSEPMDYCYCGVPALEGVVPSELGKGFYCGNTRGTDYVSSFGFSLIFE